MEEVSNGYVTNPNPTPTLTPIPNSNPNPNRINKKFQKETTLENRYGGLLDGQNSANPACRPARGLLSSPPTLAPTCICPLFLTESQSGLPKLILLSLRTVGRYQQAVPFRSTLDFRNTKRIEPKTVTYCSGCLYFWVRAARIVMFGSILLALDLISKEKMHNFSTICCWERRYRIYQACLVRNLVLLFVLV